MIKTSKKVIHKTIDNVNLIVGDKYILLGIVRSKWVILSESAVIQTYSKVINDTFSYLAFKNKSKCDSFIKSCS